MEQISTPPGLRDAWAGATDWRGLFTCSTTSVLTTAPRARPKIIKQHLFYGGPWRQNKFLNREFPRASINLSQLSIIQAREIMQNKWNRRNHPGFKMEVIQIELRLEDLRGLIHWLAQPPKFLGSINPTERAYLKAQSMKCFS